MALDEITTSNDDSVSSETFLPAEIVFCRVTESTLKVDACTMTETLPSPFVSTRTPCTPTPVLRKRVADLQKTLLEKEKENNDLKEELEDLSHFTRLEQQIGVHASATAKNSTFQVN